MIDVSGIRHVQARIAQLQEKFGIPGGGPGVTFQQHLQREMQKSDGTRSVSPDDPAAVNISSDGGKTGQRISFPTVSENLPLADQSLGVLIDGAAKKYRVDPKLLSAIAQVESGGNQDATSSAGAVGVMQLMPDTAASLGVNPYDKKQNIEGGAKYLREMLDSFDGDIRKAVAAYNAGPQAVRDYGGVPPYRETQNYVNKVLDLYH